MSDTSDRQPDSLQLNESQLATIVGFQQETKAKTNIDTEPEEVQQAADTELQKEDPRTYFTRSPLWANPILKIAVVTAGSSVFAFAGYQLLSSLMKPLPSRQSSLDLQQFPLPDEKTREQKEAKDGEVALGDQARAFEKLEEQNNFSGNKTNSKPELKQPELPKVSPTPKPARVIPQAQQRSYIPPVPMRRQQALPVSLPAPIRPAPRPSQPLSVPQQPPPTPEPTVNPTERWLALSQLGSWGQTTEMAEAAMEEGVEVEEVEDDTVVSLSKSNSKSKSNDSEQVVFETSKVIEEEEAPILQEQPRQTLMAGTTCKGILTQLLVHDGSAKQETEDGRRITVLLTEPLLAADGLVALPEQTQVMAEIRSFSEEGVVQLVAVSVLLEEEGSVVEVPLPKDTVTIYSSDGTPLIADRVPEKKGRNTNISTLGRFARGALEHAATQGLGSGAEGLLEESVKEGAVAVFGRRRSQSDRRSNTFFLPVGTKVQLSVDRSFALDAFVSVSPF